MIKQTKTVPASGQQMSLPLDPRKLDGMNETERAKAVQMLAVILMQAAGMVVEEFSDDQH